MRLLSLSSSASQVQWSQRVSCAGTEAILEQSKHVTTWCCDFSSFKGRETIENVFMWGLGKGNGLTFPVRSHGCSVFNATFLLVLMDHYEIPSPLCPNPKSTPSSHRGPSKQSLFVMDSCLESGFMLPLSTFTSMFSLLSSISLAQTWLLNYLQLIFSDPWISHLLWLPVEIDTVNSFDLMSWVPDCELTLASGHQHILMSSSGLLGLT